MTTSLFGVFMVYLVILIFEAPSLFLKKYWRELIAFLLFWGFSLTLAVLYLLNIPIPNPQEIINNSVNFIFRLIKT